MADQNKMARMGLEEQRQELEGRIECWKEVIADFDRRILLAEEDERKQAKLRQYSARRLAKAVMEYEVRRDKMRQVLAEDEAKLQALNDD